MGRVAMWSSSATNSQAGLYCARLKTLGVQLLDPSLIMHICNINVLYQVATTGQITVLKWPSLARRLKKLKEL